MFEHGSDVKRTARVNRQMVRQRGKLSGFVHKCRFSMIWSHSDGACLTAAARHPHGVVISAMVVLFWITLEK
jgi:hypothetical protein